MAQDQPSPGLWAAYKRLSLGTRILIWMGAGVLAGILFGEAATVARPLGELFIRLLLMAAIPLVFFNLIAGLTSLADVSILGRLGLRTLGFYLLTTTLALSVGIAMASWLEPGRGMRLSGSVAEEFGEVPKVIDILLDLVPENVFAAFSSANVAQVVVFAIVLGIAALTLPEEQRSRLQAFFTLAAELLRGLVKVVLHFAPIGVGALAATTVGEHGGAIFGPLAKFIFAVWSAQAVMVVFYLTLLALFSGHRPWTWLARTGPLYATTAATCSSLASLVVAMDVAEKRLRIPKRIYSFTLPLGAQLNKDGTAIMLTGVLLFTAQAAGIEFSLARLLTILVIGLILSEGSGGIPGGGLVIAMIFVEAFHLPLEVAGIVAGIYRLIDMGSTTINCMGDMTWTTIVSGVEARREAARQEAR